MPAFPYPNPQPTGNAVTFSDALGTDISVDVYTKQRWADSWVADTQVDLLAVSWNAAPNIPTASLRYRYGRVVEISATTETTRTKKTWIGWYVKIVVHCADGDRIWHGFVDDVADEQHGTVTRTVPGAPGDPPTILHEVTGVQTISAVGMVAALDRAPIQRTYYGCTATFANNGTDVYRVAWSAPMFNVSDNTKVKRDQFGGTKLPPSRSTVTYAAPGFGLTGQTRDTYIHSFPGLYGIPDTNTADRWTLKTILEYLAAYNAPRVGNRVDSGPFADGKSQFVPVWIFDHVNLDSPNTATQYADWFESQLDCDGLTLKAALDRLLSPSAGQGYFCFVDETVTPNRLYVEPFTTVTANVSMTNEAGDTKTLPANTRVIAITAATDSATAVSVQSNGSTNYTLVSVIGAPMVTVFTMDTTDQLTPAWSTTLEDDYNAEIAGLNAAIMRQLQRMRDIRELPKYQPIGRNYRIKHLYNWKDGAGPTDVFRMTVGNLRYLPFGLRLRLLSGLPMREGIDYSQANTTTVKTSHEASKSPYRALEVYAKTHESDGTLTGKWICWSAKAPRDVLYDPNDPSYGLTARELTNEMAVGLAIEVSGGYQGALAAGGGRVAPHVPRIDPVELKLTVAALSDCKLQATKRNPASLGSTASNIDADRTKVFDLGDKLQSIEIMDQTIVGVDDTGPKTVPARFKLRDDEWLAKQIADFLATYYFVPRSIVRIQSRRASAKLWPGQIIGTLNAATNHAVTSNAIISEVAITMGVGANGAYIKPTFTVQTSFGELDPLQFFPQLNQGE
jgi:hypothetical protein